MFYLNKLLQIRFVLILIILLAGYFVVTQQFAQNILTNIAYAEDSDSEGTGSGNISGNGDQGDACGNVAGNQGGNQGNGPDIPGGNNGCTQVCTPGYAYDTCVWICPPPPEPVNGSCSVAVYGCSVGGSVNNSGDANQWTWTCTGSNGGSDVACVSPKPPVIVSFTANPTKVNAGSLSTLNWVVTGSNNCSAGSSWSGAKNPNGGNENVFPPVTSTYLLTCSGPGGGPVSSSATVLVPTGSITAGACTIPIDQPSCSSPIAWTSSNFMGTPEVVQNGIVFDTRPTGSDNREVTPDNYRFILRDTVGSFSIHTDASVNCATGSVWVDAIPLCMRLPEISITANPNVIRNGNTAPLEISITANYDMTCTLKGGINQTFTHSASVSDRTYNDYETNPLTAGQVVSIDCTNDMYPVVKGRAETRVEVTAKIEDT